MRIYRNKLVARRMKDDQSVQGRDVYDFQSEGVAERMAVSQ